MIVIYDFVLLAYESKKKGSRMTNGHCIFEKFHERRQNLIERREDDDCSLSIEIDRKRLSLRLLIESVTRQDVFSSANIHVVKDKVNNFVNFVLPEIHSVLTFSGSDYENTELAVKKVESCLAELSILKNLKTEKSMSSDESRRKSTKGRFVFENLNLSVRMDDLVHLRTSNCSNSADFSGAIPQKKNCCYKKTPEKLTDSVNRRNVALSPQQVRAIGLAKKGKNLFISGGAGTGKTTLLESLIIDMKKFHGQSHVFVTATTGMCAVALGGTTCNQFAGLTVIDHIHTDEDIDKAVNEVVSLRPAAVQRLIKCRCLVIDEVSMLSPVMLRLLHRLANKVRKSDETQVFGGIQVILVGDFFQLPPVLKGKDGMQFCFQCSLWETLVQETVILDHPYRQMEASFARVLEDIRWGRWTNAAQALFATVAKEAKGQTEDFSSSGCETHLFTHRADVDALNTKELNRLEGKEYCYEAKDKGQLGYLKMLQHASRAPQVLKLKKHALVVLCKSIDFSQGLVNGLTGEVVGFTKTLNNPLVLFKKVDPLKPVQILPATFRVTQGDQVVASRIQVPLALGWGLSIHGAQGMSLDKATLHLKHTFEYGQAYVALSRLRSLEGCHLSTPLQEKQIRAHPAAVAFYERISNEQGKSRKGAKELRDKENKSPKF